MDTYALGTRVRSVSEGPLGVLDPGAARAAFLADVYVLPGDAGTVVVPDEQMPDGWLLVDFDGKGIAPVHPGMVAAA